MKRRILLPLTLCLVLGACNITGGFVSSLESAVLNNRDIATVEQGSPAYLLLVDALASDSDDPELLSAAANLHNAYAGVFVTDMHRQQLMTSKALAFAERAVCEEDDDYCELRRQPFETFTANVREMDDDEIDSFYALATAWAGWISAHRSDWNAIADMGRVETLLQHIIRINPEYKKGDPYLYLGVLATLLPEAMGGRPEQGKLHFEKAIALSNGKNLMAKVTYAKQYARLKFDRELHDQLLIDVLQADVTYPQFTLINTFAQQQAKQLMESADDYF
ncbi:TRAP transporter TatT component family protein [Permianibacter aggregans]|uniref:TRAP transporter TatT component family protein n=1 Tax=Permianibacter aggregans TaxID=1510150 RepID=A0A4V6PWQ3_9GAMM|nr:TRAP transporter TatT component family protein [Permianibacter aggregans]QGX40268.1 hypothetical protein E2H98_11530 [Permianibacter aggregans]TDQ47527.1 TRAP transporter TatT component family protein [Permianibacter aggregans]